MKLTNQDLAFLVSTIDKLPESDAKQMQLLTDKLEMKRKINAEKSRITITQKRKLDKTYARPNSMKNKRGDVIA